ncbi:non-homologous end-joining factor 1-like isoform X2 [Limulus polyphemus]|uniref:Non-homologous end-joining factor 1 n=2 Tax=Limulus polyphemus TaxID=6850 RepID=A0ABM1BJT6_LIMPO|nr:non-homologous end-joining factor 1-like isoform X2 [Limulus polyphemus]
MNNLLLKMADNSFGKQSKLNAVPWKYCTVSYKNRNLLVKFEISETSYQLFVTDLVHLYSEQLLKTDLHSRTQKLNPKIEVPTNRLLQEIESILSEASSWNTGKMHYLVEVREVAEAPVLKVESYLAGVPFLWEFYLQSEHGEQFNKQVVSPLLYMVAELQRQQRELIARLKSKDAEIDNYKASGATVSRKQMETLPFNEENFRNDMNIMKDVAENLKMAVPNVFSKDAQKLYEYVVLASYEAQTLKSLTAETEQCRDKITKNETPKEITTLHSHSSCSQKDVELQRRKELQRKLEIDHEKKKKRKIKL